MKYVGKRYPMVDAVAKVTGTTIFTDDMFFPGMLYGKVLFSPIAHGRITSIDTSKAEALPGVHAVISHHDSPSVGYNSIMRSIDDEFPKTMKVLDSTVRYVGDPVAAVAADTERIAAAAVKLIEVTYQELPAVFEPEDALKDGAYPIHPGGNLIKDMLVSCGDCDAAMAEADQVFESVASTQRIHHGSMETFVVSAHWSPDGILSVWSPNHSAYGAMFILSNIFEVPMSRIRFYRMPIGGSFGSKTHVVLEPLALLLARKSGRHVRLRYNRAESIISTNTRHAYKIYIKTAVTREGTVTAQDLRVYLNAGPHNRTTTSLAGAMFGKIPKLYRVPNLRLHGLPTYTNGPLGGAMRGFGSPAGFFAIELQMDRIAKALGIDPVELRRRNLVHPYDIEPVNKTNIGNARVLDCLERGAEAFGWEERRRQVSADGRYKLGCGVAVGLHGNGVYPIFPDMTSMTLMLQEDGSIRVSTGLCEMGAGTYTILPQLIGEVLSIPPERIDVLPNDSPHSPFDYGASASRNTWVGGNAALELAGKIRDKLIHYAAEKFGVEETNIALDEQGLFTLNGAHRASRQEIILYAYHKHRVRFMESVDYASKANAGSFGAHFAQVRVDSLTGEVQVLEYVAACDVGRALNPMLLEGQIEGSIHMGIGYALTEEVKVDPGTGRVTNASFKHYQLIKPAEMPRIKVIFVEELEEAGPFGAKSIGEAALVPVAPAVVNAINHALGTEFSDLPVTPAKILGKIQNHDL
jgi:CO/xanthine dehydrogenase Mo-binding subunit